MSITWPQYRGATNAGSGLLIGLRGRSGTGVMGASVKIDANDPRWRLFVARSWREGWMCRHSGTLWGFGDGFLRGIGWRSYGLRGGTCPASSRFTTFATTADGSCSASTTPTASLTMESLSSETLGLFLQGQLTNRLSQGRHKRLQGSKWSSQDWSLNSGGSRRTWILIVRDRCTSDPWWRQVWSQQVSDLRARTWWRCLPINKKVT